LTIDVTEVRIQRPKDHPSNGKKTPTPEKKYHTYKVLIIKGNEGKILSVSELYKGTVADYQLLKQEFPPGQSWFKDHVVRIDLAFEGFDSDYACQKMRKSYKRKRVAKGCSNELSQQQKDYNKEVAAERVPVEHCIGRMKQVRMIQQTIRIHKASLIDRIVGVTAGLANFKIE
jgi:hypothetical protein